MKTSLMFLLGLGMGTVLGILVAPEAGKITRRKIREEADRIVDKALAKKSLKDANLPLDGDMEPAVVRSVVEERYTI